MGNRPPGELLGHLSSGPSFRLVRRTTKVVTPRRGLSPRAKEPHSHERPTPTRPRHLGAIKTDSRSGAWPRRLRRAELGTLNVHTARRTKNGGAADLPGCISSSEGSEFQVQSSEFSPPQARWHLPGARGFGPAVNHAPHPPSRRRLSFPPAAATVHSSHDERTAHLSRRKNRS